MLPLCNVIRGPIIHLVSHAMTLSAAKNLSSAGIIVVIIYPTTMYTVFCQRHLISTASIKQLRGREHKEERPLPSAAKGSDCKARKQASSLDLYEGSIWRALSNKTV